jgi:hypothetical protein
MWSVLIRGPCNGGSRGHRAPGPPARWDYRTAQPPTARAPGPQTSDRRSGRTANASSSRRREHRGLLPRRSEASASTIPSSSDPNPDHYRRRGNPRIGRASAPNWARRQIHGATDQEDAAQHEFADLVGMCLGVRIGPDENERRPWCRRDAAGSGHGPSSARWASMSACALAALCSSSTATPPHGRAGVVVGTPSSRPVHRLAREPPRRPRWVRRRACRRCGRHPSCSSRRHRSLARPCR